MGQSVVALLFKFPERYHLSFNQPSFDFMAQTVTHGIPILLAFHIGKYRQTLRKGRKFLTFESIITKSNEHKRPNIVHVHSLGGRLVISCNFLQLAWSISRENLSVLGHGSLLLGSLLPVILEGHVWASIEGERVL